MKEKPGFDNVYRYLITSSMVYFHSSLSFAPDVSCNTFSSFRSIEQTTNEEKRKKLIDATQTYSLEFVELNNQKEIEELAQQYMDAKIIPEKKYMDALHVAVAVTKQIPYLVSWNYKHLANINKEQQIKIINIRNHYLNDFRIITPLELIYYAG